MSFRRPVPDSIATTLVLLFGLVLIGAVEPLAADSLEVGEAVPALAVEEMLTGPGPAALTEALGSEAVVVELWATWCAPCVAAIRDWNEIVDELADEPVRFVSVSDEEAEQVRRFLDRKPIAGWVAIDSDRSIFETFEVRAIPRTVLIDAQGRLQGMAHPNGVTADTVRALVAGRPLELPDKPSREQVAMSPEGQPEALYEVSLRPTTREDMYMSMGHGDYDGGGLRPRLLLSYAWDVAPSRLVLETDLPDQRYDFRVRTGEKEPEPARAAARLALEAAFDWSVTTETREREVWLLTRLPGVEPKLEPAVVKSGTALQNNTLTALSVTTEHLASLLEDVLDQPVVDETGLEGEWEVELQWEKRTADSLQAAVRETLGLDLQPGLREIEVTVVRGEEPEEADGTADGSASEEAGEEAGEEVGAGGNTAGG